MRAPDLIVLDIVMPEEDGLSTCRELRKHSGVPIIFLSSRDDELDRVLGLELGGDDYLSKPFSPRELVARVAAVLRRMQPDPDLAARASTHLTNGRLHLDLVKHRCHVDERELLLTVTEFELLRALLGAPGRVFDHAQLITLAYGDDHHITERTVDSHVRRLRKKLAEAGTEVSVLFSTAIAAPLRRLTRAARAIADGPPSIASSKDLAPSELAPAEVAVLADVLQTMTTRLTERARYVTEFASNASHELKSPITAIRGAAELLSQHENMSPAQRARFVANIMQDAERMERLVTRMLELARIESEVAEPAEKLDVRAACTAMLARYAPNVQLELDEAPAELRIAEAHLHTVLVNLVENALRHGAGKPVRVRLGTDAGRLSIAVRDQGPGISEANQTRLFQRFFTTERDRGGTGLGLSIVKAIAEARGGTVSAASSPEGSTFNVLL